MNAITLLKYFRTKAQLVSHGSSQIPSPLPASLLLALHLDAFLWSIIESPTAPVKGSYIAVRAPTADDGFGFGFGFGFGVVAQIAVVSTCFSCVHIAEMYLHKRHQNANKGSLPHGRTGKCTGTDEDATRFLPLSLMNPVDDRTNMIRLKFFHFDAINLHSLWQY